MLEKLKHYYNRAMLIRSSIVYLFTVFSCLTFGSTPPCPAIVQKIDERHANAGCLVLHNDQLLLVQTHNWKISIPGGSQKAGEPAACTAFRETWEETSLLTSPTRVEHVWNNDFIMYHCQLKSPANEATVQRPIEIKQILWLGVEDFDNYSWRFPYQKKWILNWLEQHSTPIDQPPESSQ